MLAYVHGDNYRIKKKKSYSYCSQVGESSLCFGDYFPNAKGDCVILKA